MDEKSIKTINMKTVKKYAETEQQLSRVPICSRSTQIKLELDCGFRIPRSVKKSPATWPVL